MTIMREAIKVKSLPCRQADVESGNAFKSGTQTGYDIVKAHGGEIKVEPIEAKGEDFFIILPILF